jgi:hypothetical protein
MKFHSDNIKATSGQLAVHNLNFFTHGDGMTREESFREAMRRAALLADEAYQHYAKFRENRSLAQMIDNYGHPLLLIAVPRIACMGDHVYKLEGGIMLWSEHLFRQGAIFSVEGNDINFITPDLIEPATTVEADFNRLAFDTYNQTPLIDVDREVLEELDVAVDFAQLQNPRDDSLYDGDVDMVHYLSVYAPNAASVARRKRVYAISKGEPKDDEGFDTTFFDSLMAINDWNSLTHFDHFLIELTGPNAIFSYVAIEYMSGHVLPAKQFTDQQAMGTPGITSDGSFMSMANAFTALFDNSNVEQLNVTGGLQRCHLDELRRAAGFSRKLS